MEVAVLVSVIIPAYNSEKYVGETIKSVLNQSWKNVEIIVVDDGSNDETLRILSEFEGQGVTVYSRQNKGACAARNFGFNMSKGNFIQFLDADDVLSPDKIDKQLAVLLRQEAYQTKIIHSRWGRFTRHLEEVPAWGPHHSLQRNLSPADWLIADHMSITSCWLVPRQLIEKAGLWDESLKRNQDGEFYSRLLLYAHEVLFTEKGAVYYRSEISNSVSRGNSRAAAESTLKSIQLIEKYIFSLEMSQRAKKAVSNKYLDLAFAYYIDYPDLAVVAEGKAKELGEGTLKLRGGGFLKIIEAVLGWKMALSIKNVLSKLTIKK